METLVETTIVDTIINQMLIPLVAIVALIIIVAVILQFIIKVKIPYKKKESLLTPTELKFYKILQTAVQDKYDISFQVRLANVVTTEGSYFSKLFWENFRPLGMKCLDFVLCEKNSGKTSLVIELDDYTHNLEHRKRRDQFIDQTLSSVGMPILHQPVQVWYEIAKLRKVIIEKIEQGNDIKSIKPM